MLTNLCQSLGILFTILLLSVLRDAVTIATGSPPFHSHGGTLAPGQDEHGGIQMGVSNRYCDNGQTNLTIDWDGSRDDFECRSRRWGGKKVSKSAGGIIMDCTTDFDHPVHICMDRAITYDDVIPTNGAHRPLWARFGEYRFLPKQRWVHNLEHGAAVFLYHPCASPAEITRLKRIARGCLRKHIITPYKELSQEHPFAIVTYGCKLQLPHVAASRIRSFLKKHVNKSPEQMVSQDGQFKEQLIEPANIVSDMNDCVVCPSEPFDQCPGAATSTVREAMNKAHHPHKGKPRKRLTSIHD